MFSIVFFFQFFAYRYFSHLRPRFFLILKLFFFSSHLQTIALIAIVGVAVAFPQNAFLTQSRIQDDFGQFALSYSSANGIAATQQGALKPIQTENGLKNVLVQQGAYSYWGPDKKLYTVRYIADETGFHAFGDHIPQAPAVPAA